MFYHLESSSGDTVHRSGLSQTGEKTQPPLGLFYCKILINFNLN